jgi:hypothetical protein
MFFAVNLINILHARFLYKILAPKITKPNVNREKLPKRLPYKKGTHKTLMKLTTGRQVNLLVSLSLFSFKGDRNKIK